MTGERIDVGAVRVVTTELAYQTGLAPWFADITADVQTVVTGSGVQGGQCTLFSRHTTAAVIINEHEPLLLRDIARLLRSLVPAAAHYDHNDFATRTVNMTADECRNGHAHLQHLLLGGGQTIPVAGGQLLLGTYQRIFLVELDHPRPRQVVVAVLGVA